MEKSQSVATEMPDTSVQPGHGIRVPCINLILSQGDELNQGSEVQGHLSCMHVGLPKLEYKGKPHPFGMTFDDSP